MIYSNIIDMDTWIKDFNGDKDKAYRAATHDDAMYHDYLVDRYDKLPANVIAVGEIDGEPFAERVGDNLGDIFRFSGYGEIYADGCEIKGWFDLGHCTEHVTYYSLTDNAPKNVVEKLALGHTEYMRYCVSVYDYFEEMAA